MARTCDPDVDDPISAAALALLVAHGFAQLSIEAVAGAAGVGKPAMGAALRRECRMIEFAVETEIDRPPDEVFAGAGPAPNAQAPVRRLLCQPR
jgi:Bacterial regulatory proteins, tetR family